MGGAYAVALEHLIEESRRERDDVLELIYALKLKMDDWQQWHPLMVAERWVEPAMRTKMLLNDFIAKKRYVEIYSEKPCYYRSDVHGRPQLYVSGRSPRYDTVLRRLDRVERGPAQSEDRFCEECRPMFECGVVNFECPRQCPGADAGAGYYLYNDDVTVSFVRFEDEAFDQAIAAAERDAVLIGLLLIGLLCRRHRRCRHYRHSN